MAESMYVPLGRPLECVPLPYPVQTVHVDLPRLAVPCAQEHGRRNQQDVCDAVMVHVHTTHLAAVVRPDLETGKVGDSRM